MNEQERQDALWLEPAPLTETWGDVHQRFRFWSNVKIVAGMGLMLGYCLWQRITGGRPHA